MSEQFQAGLNMRIACDPIEVFEVPSDIDPQVFKEGLLTLHCGPQIRRRDLFIEAMSRWLLSSAGSATDGK